MRIPRDFPPVFRNTVALGLITTAVKMAGAAKLMATARYFGAGDAIDAFLTAFLLPSLIADIFAGSLTPSLIPELIRAGRRTGDSESRVAQSSMTAAICLMTCFALVLAVFGRWILLALGSSFPPAKLSLTATLFLPLLLWLPMSGCIAVFRAVLNVHNHFVLPAGASIATPMVTILALGAAAPGWRVYALSVGTLVGVLIELMVLAIAVLCLGCAIRPAWFGWTLAMKTVFGQYVPLVTGAIIASGSGIVDQAFAGTLGTGAVAVLAYGNKLATVMLAIGATALNTAALPAFSRLVAGHAWDQLRRTASTYACLGLCISLPAVIVMMIWSRQIVHLLFQHGSFNVAVTPAVAWTQRCALIQVPFAILLTLAVRLASAMSANALLMRVALAAFVVNLAGDVVFARWFGVAGIALSTALVQFVSVMLLITLLVRKQPALAPVRVTRVKTDFPNY